MAHPRTLGCLLAIAVLSIAPLASPLDAQDCRNGQCRIGFTEVLQPFTLNELLDVEQIELTADTAEVAASTVDRFERVVSATCRVTVSGVCGSGTVVGRDTAGNALVPKPKGSNGAISVCFREVPSFQVITDLPSRKRAMSGIPRA